MRTVALILLLAGTGYALRQWTWIPLRCAHAASLAQIAIEDAASMSDADKRNVARRIRADLGDCPCVSPANVAIPTALADAAAMIGDHEIAIAQYERALQLDRRPMLYLRLGLAQLNAFDRPAAIASLTRACAFNPGVLAAIPYQDVRREVAARLLAAYGPGW